MRKNRLREREWERIWFVHNIMKGDWFKGSECCYEYLCRISEKGNMDSWNKEWFEESCGVNWWEVTDRDLWIY